MESVKIIENFKSFQGEGPDCGCSMLILRFKYCDRVENKKPCEFCDTILKMRITNESESKIEDIQKIINIERCGVLITGGETTYEKHINDCISLINNLNYPIANVETNGYNIQKLLNEIDKNKKVKMIYSPKFFNSDELEEDINKTKQIYKDERVFIKVVVEESELIRTYLSYVSGLGINNRIYLMPEGKTRDELIKNSPIVFDICEEYKFNFSSRTHLMFDFI